MEIFKQNSNINFMGLKKYTGSISILLIILSIILLFKNGLNFGLEFTGGMQIELRFQGKTAIEQIRQRMSDVGFKNMRIQHYGSAQDILIRISEEESLYDEKILREKISHAFSDASQNVAIMRIEYVGSEVGKQLAEQGGLAMLVAILATMIYIAMRFEYRFALSAAIALMHDVIIILGIFALFKIEFDLASLAAVLAILGYSLNDTIVIFDRVRENFRKMRKNNSAQIINISINNTLSRTIMTSWLTLLVAIALLFFGGASLFSFSLVLCLGIIIGTYSSIYVAGACALLLGLSRSDLLQAPKVELDNMP